MRIACGSLMGDPFAVDGFGRVFKHPIEKWNGDAPSGAAGPAAINHETDTPEDEVVQWIAQAPQTHMRLLNYGNDLKSMPVIAPTK